MRGARGLSTCLIIFNSVVNDIFIFLTICYVCNNGDENTINFGISTLFLMVPLGTKLTHVENL